MTDPFYASSVAPCPGPQARRDFLKMGLAGFASLSLPGMLRLRAESPAKNPKEKTAVILVWQPGGCSHIDTYDPKPNAASEYRGPLETISTKVPGMQFSELLPLQAKIADKIAVLRSMRHGSPGHGAGTMRMLSGDPEIGRASRRESV